MPIGCVASSHSSILSPTPYHYRNTAIALAFPRATTPNLPTSFVTLYRHSCGVVVEAMRQEKFIMTQVWLDRSLLRHVPGCLAELRHVSLVPCFASRFASFWGLSHRLKKDNPVLKILHTLGQSHEQAATSGSGSLGCVGGTQWRMYMAMMGKETEAINRRKATKVGDPM